MLNQPPAKWKEVKGDNPNLVYFSYAENECPMIAFPKEIVEQLQSEERKKLEFDHSFETAWCPKCSDQMTHVEKELDEGKQYTYFCEGCDKTFVFIDPVEYNKNLEEARADERKKIANMLRDEAMSPHRLSTMKPSKSLLEIAKELEQPVESSNNETKERK